MNSILSEPIEGLEPLLSGPKIEPVTSEAYKAGMNQWDMLGRTFENESLFYMLGNNYGSDDSAFKEDVNWNKEEARLEIENEIHPRFIDNLMAASKSQEHLDSLYEEAKNDSIQERYIESQGFFYNLGMNVLPELTNAPLYIGAAVAGTALAPATTAIAGSSFLGAALIGATADLGVEGLKDVIGKHDKNYIDYLASAVIGGAASGVFGRSAGAMESVAEREMKRTAGITKEVEEAMANAGSAEERKAIADKAFFDKNSIELSESGFEQLDRVISSTEGSVVQRGWQAVRQDLAYVTGKSESPSVRGFSEQMFPDPTLQALNKTTPDIQSSIVRLENQMEGVFQQEMQPIIREFSDKILKSIGFLGIRPSGSSEDAFSKLVGYVQKMKSINQDLDEGLLIRKSIEKNGYTYSKDLDAIVAKGVKAAGNISEKQHKLLKEAGNTRFQKDGIPVNRNYMHFVYDKSILTSFRNMGVPEKQLSKFFSNAIKSHLVKTGVKNIDNVLTDKIGFLFYKAISESNIDTGKTFNSMIDDALKTKNLKQEELDILESMKKEVVGKSDEEAGVAFRGRTGIDYEYSQAFINNKGQKVDLSVADLISDNYATNMRKYHRKSAGATGLQKMKWKSKTKGKTADEIKLEVESNPQLIDLMNQKVEVDAIKRQLDELGIDVNDIIQGAKNLDLPEPIARFIDSIEAKVIAAKNLDTDIINLQNKLVKEAMDESNAQKGIDTERTLTTKKDIEEYKQQVVNELQKAVDDGKMKPLQMKKELTRLNHILTDLQGLPTAKEANSTASQVQRIFASLNMFRLLGQTGFTMTAEGATVAVDSGIKNMFKAMPEFASIMKAYRTGKIDSKVAAEIQESTGLLTEFLSSPKVYELSHEYSPSGTSLDTTLGKVQGVVDHMAEFTLMMGGIKPMTAMFKVAHMQGVMKQMKDVALGGKASNTYTKMLNELGLSNEASENVYKNILKHSDDTVMNFNKWDLDTKNLFLDGITRRSDTLIQQKRLGDTMAWVHGESDHLFQSTVMGKVLMELKTFSLVSHTKQLGRIVNRADAHSAMLVASWATALSLSYMAKSNINFAGNEEKLKHAMSPEIMIPAVIGQMPLAGMLPQAIDAAAIATVGSPVFGHSRNSGQMTDFFSSLPTIDAINNIGKTIGTPMKSAFGDGVSVKDFNPLMKTTGLKNNILTRPFVEANQ